MGTAIKHAVPDWVKPSFVIFDIRALWRSALRISVWISKITNYGLTRSGWHRILKYSCTHLATVDIDGIKKSQGAAAISRSNVSLAPSGIARGRGLT